MLEHIINSCVLPSDIAGRLELKKIFDGKTPTLTQIYSEQEAKKRNVKCGLLKYLVGQLNGFVEQGYTKMRTTKEWLFLKKGNERDVSQVSNAYASLFCGRSYVEIKPVLELLEHELLVIKDYET